MEAYILTLLHFNIQYCAGGTAGLIEVAGYANDDASVQDQTIVESFDPILTMLEAHPSWQMDIELQAYMVEIIRDRHPETLTRLRALAERGQVELVSFHYSDQLFLAYPWRDQQKSLELTAEVFADADLPLSNVAFTQEGQFGEGMLQRMPEFGYATAVLPHNLAEAAWGSNGAQATYRYGDDVRVIVGGAGFSTADYSVSWHFLNDGELYATNDLNCYLGPAFVYDPEDMAKREAELQAQEDAGAKIASISAFMDAHGNAAETELPSVVDGTWQPDDTGNFLRWMGGMGIWGADKDEQVLVGNVRARHRLAAAELVEDADPDLLAEGWREALLGQVSDATGWNPLDVEVSYGIDHGAAAYELAAAAVADACVERGADWLSVDIATHVVTPNGQVEVSGGEAATAPVDVAFPGRAGTATWTTTGAGDVLAVSIHLDAGEDPAIVRFPWDGIEYATIPALTETMREIPAAEVTLDPIGLPLPLGVFRLSEGVWGIKKTDTTHLAGVYSKVDSTIQFQDETGSADARTGEYRVVLGDAARATEVALALNAYPVVDLMCPGGDASAELPCGCAAGATSGGLGASALATLAMGALALLRRIPVGAGQGRG